MGGRFWVGTSGWNYNHWKEVFYPRGLLARKWLSYYSERFPTVELNNSFYREPSERSWDSWKETAPSGFRFAVKAHRYLTHVRRLSEPEESLERVVKGARRLGPRLGPILYQLPPGFHRTEENVGRLDHLLELLPGDLMHAIEFRHDSWFGEETLERLRREKAAFCSFHRSRMECPLEATARFAYVRFHGTGSNGGNYSDEELEEWAGRLDRLSRDVDEVYVYFNNDAQGYAVKNALAIAEMLRAPMPAPA
jgi:uncharacterized protein YecE (DUF72 family)